MKFLRLFPRRHFAGKPVETSGDVVKCSLFSEANVTVVTYALEDRLRYPPEPTTNITLLGNSARPCTLITSGVGD